MDAALDLTSPEETAARRARIAASQQESRTRLQMMSEARALRRTTGVKTVCELQQEIDSLISAVPDLGDHTDLGCWRKALEDLACALDDGRYVRADFMRAVHLRQAARGH